MRFFVPALFVLAFVASPAPAQLPRNGSGGSGGGAKPASHPAKAGGSATPASTASGAGAGAVTFVSPGAAKSSGFVDLGAARFEFHARDLPVSEVFAQLRKVTHQNILLEPGADALFTGDLFDVTTEDCLRLICKATGLAWKSEGPFFIVGKPELESRVFTLDYARGSEVVPFIEPLLGPGGSVTATSAAQKGIPTSAENAGGDDFANHDLLLVQAMPDRMERIEEVVKQIDAEPLQVMIEATIMVVKLNGAFELGVQWKALLGQDFEDVGASSSNGTTLNNFGYDTGQIQSGAGTAATAFAGRIAGGLNVGLFKKSINVLIHALEAVSSVKILANPRVLVLNKQRGEVLLGRRDGFLTTTVTMTSSTQTVEYLETGTRLVFRPYVSRNGMVRLEIHPEDSNGGLNDKGLPFKDTTEVTTNIMVPDAGTVVIGGLFRERKQDIEDRVPFLGSIPVLGVAFRSKHQETSREEVVVVLRPHVLKSSLLAGDPTAQGSNALETASAKTMSAPLSEAWLRQGTEKMGQGDAATSWFFLEQRNAARASKDPSTSAGVRAEAGNGLLRGAIDPRIGGTQAAIAAAVPASAPSNAWFLLEKRAPRPPAPATPAHPSPSPPASPVPASVDPLRDALRSAVAAPAPIPAGWSASSPKAGSP